MSQEAFEAFERSADARFEAHKVPHPNLYASTWYLLTVSEDQQRMWFKGATGESHSEVEFLLDKVKFSLRSCLMLVLSKATDRSNVVLPARVVPDLYIRAKEMIYAGIDYALVSQVCGTVYAGDATVEWEDGNFKVEVNEKLVDSRYVAFELMRQSVAEQLEVPMSTLFWWWIHHEEEQPDVLQDIVRSVQIKARRVVYKFDPILCHSLAQSAEQRTLIIPQSWEFPWGGHYETVLLMNSLSLRVLYHVCAVHFGAVARRLAGAAEHDLVLVQSEDAWVRDIQENSSLDTDHVRLFVRYLTLGNGVTSPDQALQPFVPLGRGLLGVPGLALMSSNIDRNLLTLQARVDPPGFNKQSKLFEKEMTASLQAAFTRKWAHVNSSRTFALGTTREELDLLVCEPESKTVLVLELRWILPPADPREVQAKKIACRAKVPQAARKRNAARSNLRQLLAAAFDLQVDDENAWRVEAAVVIEGFGGALTIDPTVPITPEWVLEEGMTHAQSLRALVDWLLSDKWLPVDGRDYRVIHEPRDLLGLTVNYGGVAPIRTGREFVDAVTSMLRSG